MSRELRERPSSRDARGYRGVSVHRDNCAGRSAAAGPDAPELADAPDLGPHAPDLGPHAPHVADSDTLDSVRPDDGAPELLELPRLRTGATTYASLFRTELRRRGRERLELELAELRELLRARRLVGRVLVVVWGRDHRRDHRAEG